MKALIVTVAGVASRFSASIGHDVLKCAFSEGNSKNTLLYRMVALTHNYFDKIVVVGGFKFDELEAYVAENFSADVANKIELVFNPHFEDRGSGWSLYLGVEALRKDNPNSIVFAEGDLFLDEKTLTEVCAASGDVLTCNSHVIDATKSVAFYCDVDMHPHYLYDTSHGTLSINEPFTRIYNSGQVWAFSDAEKLFELSSALPEEAHSRTNLELINSYFSSLAIEQVEVFEFKEWVNCNTINDYRRAFDLLADK